MSPEQARGEEDLDHRCDIWALGVLLYECLTGEVPFRANNYLGIISQVLTHKPTPPSKLRPELGISDAVEAVVMRAMEKDRALRYQTMADLERDLERLLAGDQNVGFVPRAAGPGVAASAGPQRWPLLIVGGGGAGGRRGGRRLAVEAAAGHATGAPAPVVQPAPPPAPPVVAAAARRGRGAACCSAAPPARKKQRVRAEARRPGSPPLSRRPRRQASRARCGSPPASKEAYPDK